MNILSKWDAGLNYDDFLKKFASADQHRRWDAVYNEIVLTPAQQTLLKSFQRDMLIAVVAGAWCGDCIQQCPIFEVFAKQTTRLRIRYFDRDEHGDIADELSIGFVHG